MTDKQADKLKGKPKDKPLQRDERRFSVGVARDKGRRKVRYVETNDPKKGCRFL